MVIVVSLSDRVFVIESEVTEVMLIKSMDLLANGSSHLVKIPSKCIHDIGIDPGDEWIDVCFSLACV